MAQYGHGACCVGKGHKNRHVAPGDYRAAWNYGSWRSTDVGLMNLLESLDITAIDCAVGRALHREQVIEAADADRGREAIHVAQQAALCEFGIRRCALGELHHINTSQAGMQEPVAALEDRRWLEWER